MKCNTEQCPFDSEDCDSKRFVSQKPVLPGETCLGSAGSLKFLLVTHLRTLLARQ